VIDPYQRMWWSANSEELYYAAPHGFENGLFNLDTTTGAQTTLSYGLDAHNVLDKIYAIDPRGGILFTRESPTAAPDLYAGHLGSTVQRTLSTFSARFPLRNSVQVSEVEWPSKDGLFTVHGLLLLPSSWHGNVAHGATLPTVVFFYGGPM